MPPISENYASPGLRPGLLLEDHPHATYDFRLVGGDEIGVPDEFGGGSKKFCYCTISFGTTDRSPVSAWKPVPDTGAPDDWNTLCTKTLGRALKRAGYPDDLKDLKALVLWRQRNTEIAAIQAGTATLQISASSNTPALGAGSDPVSAALEEAAVADPEQVGGDEDDVVTGELVDEDAIAEINELVAGLNRTERSSYLGFLASIDAPTQPERMTAEQLAEVLHWLDPDADS